MDDFIETSIKYYVQSSGDPDVAKESVANNGSCCDSLNPFASVTTELQSFLGKALGACAEFQQCEEALLGEAVQERISTLKSGALETYSVIADLATNFLPKIKGNEPLPVCDLTKLNSTLLSSESRYPYSAAKSDTIPEQLLKAEPGAKLYANLLKKVEAVCSRTLQEVEQKEIAAFRAWLLDGGHDGNFDLRRSKLRDIRKAKLEQLWHEYVESLSQSDHLPLYETVEVGSKPHILNLMVWNVMEFPKPHSAAPVLDGISPYCDMVLRAIEQKGTQERQLLLDALSFEPVIQRHSKRVVELVTDALESQNRDIVLLQEIDSDLQKLIADRCRQKGWSVHFSSNNEDASKCDAITAVVSTSPFDEEAQVEVVENKKVRHFAAVRQGSTWVVSCHVPLVNSKKPTPGILEDNAFKVLEQLAARFLADGGGNALVAGGDWNSNVREVADRASAASLAGCSHVRVHAPQHLTCLGSTVAIDGVISLH